MCVICHFAEHKTVVTAMIMHQSYHSLTLYTYPHTLTHWGRDKNGHSFADDTFKRIFLDENVRVSIRISLKFVLKGPSDNIPALVQIMAWCRSDNKPLSEPMMVNSLTHICVTRPQWVKYQQNRYVFNHDQMPTDKSKIANHTSKMTSWGSE